MTPLEKAKNIADALPEGGLFHEKSWRISPDAFAISGAFADELDHLGYRLVRFQQACNQLYYLSVKGRQPAWIADLLDRGKPRELVEFARNQRFRNDIPSVIRPDIILTDDGYILAELDSVPGGIGLTAWLSSVYAGLGEDVLGGANGMLTGFSSVFSGGDIVVSDEASTYLPEMNWLAARLNAVENSPDRWRVTDASDRASFAAQVYRFFELFDLANVPCSDSLMAAALSGEARVTAPFKPWMEEKMWFALFWLKPLEAFWRTELSERVFVALRKVIPYTWLVDPTPLPMHAVLPRLDAHSWDDVAAFSQKQRDFVLKVSGFHETAWGSRGVVMAADVPQTEWREALRDALAAYPTHPHILQEFHKGRLIEQSWWNQDVDAVVTMKGRVRLCPYYFPDSERVKCAGALATICPADKKLLHGMEDAILVPAAVQSR
jgi:hypothetical protein